MCGLRSVTLSRLDAQNAVPSCVYEVFGVGLVEHHPQTCGLTKRVASAWGGHLDLARRTRHVRFRRTEDCERGTRFLFLSHRDSEMASLPWK